MKTFACFVPASAGGYRPSLPNVFDMIGCLSRIRGIGHHLAIIVVCSTILLGARQETKATPIDLPYFDPTTHTVGFQLQLLTDAQYFAEIGHASYEMSFDLSSTGYGAVGFFQVYWNGYPIYDLQNHSPFENAHFTFTRLPSALGLQFQTFPVSSSPFTFTNISVRRTTNAVPETGGRAALLAMSLAGISVLRYLSRPEAKRR